MTNPIRPTDDDARSLATSLLHGARHAALGVLTPDASPMVTRVACGWIDGAMRLLVSDLSAHSKALKDRPICSLLVGEPGDKGDPLTHPRLTLQCKTVMADKGALRAPWLSLHPKSKLYIDFTDFHFLTLIVSEAHLNGGFGKAFHLTPEDLT
ncbi:HugZ family pyridoxamine 5'-phosphate oxidase [Pseudooctadecabacter jejudonensis]|uniref:Pyridoxamine 5'-phosphate oxidase putative domain-containing protein n=1 Tax=Pseudooctadecabacter jejudonensis TaxID=1391910 RepID=A0A1Y5SR96_9RHOB|nr:pyridoxamine 5-phosphate oxidase [Pseudooctadecabacter jejudonensis]SLN46456.1 hypothetical protein PSJ8397_02426 [Pseudooctadecabacter jejudonensis]